MVCDDSYGQRDPAQRRGVRRGPKLALALVVARRKLRDKDAFFGARVELADLQDGMRRLTLGARHAGDPGFQIPDNDNGFDHNAH